MSILLRSAILKAIEAGDIHIDPFVDKNVGANSVDLRLSKYMGIYDDHVLDVKKDNKLKRIVVQEDGHLLLPKELYICSTIETACSRKYVPCIETRNSMSRLGISSHTLGFGDLGWSYNQDLECTFATWTLALSVIRPVRVYANMRIAQVVFHTAEGNPEGALYKGKYGKQKMPQGSLAWKDLD